MSSLEERVKERVARGAAWLDAKVPDWVRLLRGVEVTFPNVRTCTLGQLYGDYHTGMSRLGVFEEANSANNPDLEVDLLMKSRGFAACRDNPAVATQTYEYDLITNAWRDEICQRQTLQPEEMQHEDES